MHASHILAEGWLIFFAKHFLFYAERFCMPVLLWLKLFVLNGPFVYQSHSGWSFGIAAFYTGFKDCLVTEIMTAGNKIVMRAWWVILFSVVYAISFLRVKCSTWYFIGSVNLCARHVEGKDLWTYMKLVDCLDEKGKWKFWIWIERVPWVQKNWNER